MSHRSHEPSTLLSPGMEESCYGQSEAIKECYACITFTLSTFTLFIASMFWFYGGKTLRPSHSNSNSSIRDRTMKLEGHD